MKSLLKYVSLLTIAVATLTLTACGGPDFDLALENGSEVIIETENIQITNQELFEMVATQKTGGIDAGLSTILDWADYLLLSDQFEIDEERVSEELEMLQDFFEDDELEQLLLAEGFADLDAYTTIIRLHILREQAVEDAIYISEEDIQELYNEWFPPTHEDEDFDDELDDEDEDFDDELDDEDEDFDDELDDEDEDFDNELDNEDEDFDNELDNEDEDEVNILAEIEEHLREEAMQDSAFEQQVLANIRYEAGLIIHSDYLKVNYEYLLEYWDVEDANISSSTSNEGVVATLGEHTLTVDELFNTIIGRLALTGQSPVLRYIDLQILDEIYDGDRDEVRANISEAKVNMLDWFYPQMEAIGLTTESEIFDYYLYQLLQELAFEDNFEPDEALVQEVYANYVPPRSVNHILVDTYEEAADLITQLEEVDEEDFAGLFSELAEEYSNCGSSHDGGSLGPLTIPSGMVEEFEIAAFALNEGEFTNEPVETEFGYHIIFVDDIEPTLTLDEHRENEMEKLRSNPVHFANFMVGLREDRNIVFHNAHLQAQYEAIVLQIEASLQDDDDDLEDDNLEDDNLEDDDLEDDDLEDDDLEDDDLEDDDLEDDDLEDDDLDDDE